MIYEQIQRLKVPLINKLQGTKYGAEATETGTETCKLKFAMDRFSWTSSSNLCVLPGESGIHQQSGIRIYDGDKKVESTVLFLNQC